MRWLVDLGGSEEILVRGECLVRRVAEERVDVQRFVFLGLNRKGSRAFGPRGGRAVKKHQRVGACRADNHDVNNVRWSCRCRVPFVVPREGDNVVLAGHRHVGREQQ